MTTEDVTLAEALRVVIVMAGLGLSGWALIDDIWDLVNVKRYGEVGGPRWVAAMEHLLFNSTLLVGWLCFLGVVAIAISLPPRINPQQDALATIAAWLNFAFGCSVLIAQVHRRVGRFKMRQLPLESWERLVKSMISGMSEADQERVAARLLAATAAGRQIGHLAANEMQPAMGILSLIAADAQMDDAVRQEATLACDALERAVTEIRNLHEQIRGLETKQ